MKLLDKITVRRHYLVLEERHVTEVLDVINASYVFYVDQDLAVGNCGWAKHPNSWFIHFDASKEQWSNIVANLKKKFKLMVRDGSKDVYVLRKDWP